MKQCSSCKVEKSPEEFSKGKTGWCKDCHAEYHRDHYQRNKDKYKKQVQEQRERIRSRNREWIGEYLRSNPCVDCGEADLVVLEFDHRERETKVSNISKLIYTCTNFDKLKEEVEKCDVRCANCHRRRTAIQMGWYVYPDV